MSTRSSGYMTSTAAGTTLNQTLSLIFQHSVTLPSDLKWRRAVLGHHRQRRCRFTGKHKRKELMNHLQKFQMLPILLSRKSTETLSYLSSEATRLTVISRGGEEI